MTQKSTGTKFKTVRAVTTDLSKFEKLIDAGRIKLFLTMKPVIKWNFANGPNQCFKCLEFGHSHGGCNKDQLCLRCGGNHKKDQCTLSKTDTPTCANCKKANKPHDHSAVSKSCPLMMEQASKQQRKTENFTRVHSQAVAQANPTYAQQAADNLTKLRNEISLTQDEKEQNLVLMIIQLFKTLNDSQNDANSANPVLLPEILTHFLGASQGEAIIFKHTQFTSEEQNEYK